MWTAVYPGQGSQSCGMGQFLFENFKSTRLLFEEASDILSVNFKKLCFEGPESELALTTNTQPALLLVSTATHRVVSETTPIRFEFGIGHSIGEYAACVGANVLSFPEALKAVRARGLAMQSAVPEGQGGMAAVMGLTPEQTRRLCQWVEAQSSLRPLEPANYNAPGQIVISGNLKAIDWLIANFPKDFFKEEGVTRVKLIPLKVSAPFHCSLMKPAQEQMAKVLEDIPFADSSYPIIQNFTALGETKAEILRKNLVQQISGPVRWIECTLKATQLQSKRFIELGHGQVLKGLCKKIDPAIECFNVNSLEDVRSLEKVVSQ